MEKILISLPDDLAVKFRVVVPARQRNYVIAKLVKKELDRRDKALKECAKAVAVCDQIRAVDKSRLLERMGKLTADDLHFIGDRLRQILVL